MKFTRLATVLALLALVCYTRAQYTPMQQSSQLNYPPVGSQQTNAAAPSFGLPYQLPATGAQPCQDPNAYFTGTTCVCRQGLYNISGACSQCPQGTLFDGLRCTNQISPQSPPPPGALPLGNYLENGTNMDTISPSSRYFNGFGGDSSYFYPAGMIPTGYNFRPSQIGSSFTPVGSCPPNQFANSSNICACIPGFTKDPLGDCVNQYTYAQGSPNSTPTQDPNAVDAPTAAKCTSRYAYVNSQGLCVCQTGYVFNTNYLCFPIPSGINCPQGAVLYGNSTCSCPRHSYNIGGMCIICPTFTYWNGSACASNCPANSNYNATTSKCTCNSGFYETSQQVCTPCPPGGTSINGICTSCPTNSRFVNGQCQCLPGTTLQNNVCVNMCPYGSYFDTSISKCVCTDRNSFIDNSKKCVPCPQGFVFDGSSCIPCSGNNYYDYSSKTCISCNPPAFIYDKKCIRCPEGTIWSTELVKCICGGSGSAGDMCENNCPTNGYFVDGSCVICPVNSQFVNGVCQCPSGYRNDTINNPNGACIPSCSSPNVLTSSGLCISCPPNSFWDSSSQSCLCKAGYTPSTFGQCVKTCPMGNIMLGDECICNKGHYPANDTSGTCPICNDGCMECSSYNTCNRCQNGKTLSGGFCQEPQSISSHLGGPNNCPLPSFSCSSGCCNCAVANCLACAGAANNCLACKTGFKLFNSLCVPSSSIISNPSITPITPSTPSVSIGPSISAGICLGGCRPGTTCVNSKCVITSGVISVSSSSQVVNLLQQQQLQQRGNTNLPTTIATPTQSAPLTLVLSSNITTTLRSSSFSIRVTPDVTYYTSSSPSPLQAVAASKSFITFSFIGVNGTPPSAYCQQNPSSLSLWSCVINYNNQPLGSFTALLTATNPQTSQSGSLSVSVNTAVSALQPDNIPL